MKAACAEAIRTENLPEAAADRPQPVPGKAGRRERRRFIGTLAARAQVRRHPIPQAYPAVTEIRAGTGNQPKKP